MYKFILNQWILGKYNEETIQNCVTKGFITEEQANTIISTSRSIASDVDV